MALRIKYILGMLAVLLVISALAVVIPGSEEALTREAEHVLRFSADPGFYEEAFHLEIQTDYRCQIYYTLDGSEPTMDSIPYTGPIFIPDASLSENRYASREDVSTGFLEELIATVSAQYPDFRQEIPHYVVPDYKVDKCTVVRAAAFRRGVPVDSITGSFFVGFGGKHAYDTVKVVSLVTAPENLFDYDKGIYVTGAAFDREKHVLGTETSPLWRWWPANYHAKGKDSERPAYVEVFDEGRVLQMTSGCGIRIQGAGSRGFAQKNFSVFARTEYCGSEEFPASLFGHTVHPHKFLLFTGSDDNIFKLKDAMVSFLSKDLPFATMNDAVPCVLFLNGEFWGTYYITEGYHAEFLRDHYGVRQDNVTIVKGGLLEEGKSSDWKLYQQMVNFIAESDMTLPENYQRAQALIDMDSYAAYYALEIFIARCDDWPGMNEAAWRVRGQESPDNPYGDGRWRWMLYDVNSPALSPDLQQADTLALTMANSPMFASLCRNPEFQQLFARKIRHIAQDIFTEEACEDYLETYLQTMTEPLCAGNLRFYGKEFREEIPENAQNMAAFFRERTAYMETMLAANFGEGI